LGRDPYNAIHGLVKPEDIFNLKGRVGVIIGGAGNMSRQFALSLGHAGATVVLADIDREKCENLADAIAHQTGSVCIGVECNVTDEKQVNDAFETVHKRFKRIDFLIYNVMTKPDGYYRPFDAYARTTWDQVIAGNLTGAFLCCRKAFEYMQPDNAGSIVLTSSIYGIVGPDQQIYRNCTVSDNIYGGDDPLNCPAPYSVSKAGIFGLVRYLATLWGKNGIRVNMLVPGGVYDDQEETFHSEYIRRTPLERMAVWSDFNGAILFLVSDASRYMTGTSLVIDGGWTAW